ncbi:MAG: hypothetical protein K9G46_07220 [Flavobacteriales bacterium]|nr:hypothetical protein [Flavobacteriales bacterium]
MKISLVLLILINAVLIQAQTLVQPGSIVSGVPLGRLAEEPIGVPSSVAFGVELLSINNYNLTGTSIYMSSMTEGMIPEYSDTVFVGDYIDSITPPLHKSHYYQFGLTFSNMFIAGGLTHRTVPLFQPVVICAAGLFDSHLGWYSEDAMRFGWTFSPPNIAYGQFNPKFIGYASSKISNAVGGLAFFPRITGVFNRFVENQMALELYDIYPEERFPTHKMFEIPLETPFYVNHVVEIDRKLLISGFEVDASTAFIKQPKAMLIDLEQQTWKEYALGFNGNNVQVISGLLGENDRTYFIIRETGTLGEFVKSRIVRYDEEEILITNFGEDFIPNTVVRQTNHGILLGGDYDRFGLKTAALFEVEQYNGLKSMIGYADLGNVETRFKHYEETILGEMILGTYDSLNGTPQGSFMTPLIHESLLSVENHKQTDGLISLSINQLQFLEPNSYNYQVVDATGRIHLSGRTSRSSLSLSGLTSGFYVISAWTEDKNQTLKTVLINR